MTALGTGPAERITPFAAPKGIPEYTPPGSAGFGTSATR